MARFYQYSTLQQLTPDTLFEVYDTQNGDVRKLSYAALLSAINTSISVNISGFITQYSVPSANGFTVLVNDLQRNVHLILTPTAGFTSGTITLPLSSNTQDGQTILVSCTQYVTALIINGNGATSVTGYPTTLAANAFFTLKYDKLTSTWYRVG